MLAPKKTKFNKSFNSNIYGLTHSNLVYGQYGIQAITAGRITSNQLEAIRIVLSRFMKNYGSFWIRIFPYMSLTKKPNETRMGRGKGAIAIWYSNIKVNQLIIEFSFLNNIIDNELSLARELTNLISHKLSIRTKLIINKE